MKQIRPISFRRVLQSEAPYPESHNLQKHLPRTEFEEVFWRQFARHDRIFLLTCARSSAG